MHQVTTADVVEALSRMMRASGKKAKGDGERQRVQPGDIVNQLATQEHKGVDPMVSRCLQCPHLCLILCCLCGLLQPISLDVVCYPREQRRCCILGCKVC